MSLSLKDFSVAQKLTLSFIALILIGSFLLSLSITHYDHAPETHFFDHLFHAVSIVCVTGLSLFPLDQVYNPIGQAIILCLIQVGGLGLVTLIAISNYFLGRQMGLSDHSLLQSTFSRKDSQNLKSFLVHVYQLTFFVEAGATLVLMIDFVPRFGLFGGSFKAFFLAVSAFSNAGIDNLGGISLQAESQNWLLNLVVSSLIIAGSLGFSVWFDLLKNINYFLKTKPHRLKGSFKKLSNQSRLIIQTTSIVLIIGTLGGWFLESNNPETIGNFQVKEQLLASFFQATTLRTAGFTTINYEAIQPATLLLYLVQMLIGGAPGSTAGGLKLVAIATIALLFKAELLGQKDVTYHFRRIHHSIIRQTLTVLIYFFTVLLIGYFCLLITELEDPFDLLVEAVSAISTTGLSMNGLTARLSSSGRFVIMALMFLGRVGPITVLLSLIQKKKRHIRYATTNLSVS